MSQDVDAVSKPHGESGVDGEEPEDILEQEALGDPRLLRIRPFRNLIAAHAISNLAIWSFYGTLVWVATYELGADARQMALLGAALSLPFVLGTVSWGFVVDRWSPKWVYVLGIASLLSAVAAAWTGGVSLVALSTASFLVGLGWGALEPSRSALTGLYIKETDLVRANGVLALAFQISLLAGSLLGGVLVAAVNPRFVYAVAALVGLLALPFAIMMPDARQQGTRPEFTLTDFGRGLRTAWRIRQIRLLLFITATGWMVFNAFFILEPIYVRAVLDRSDSAIQYLWTAHGVGAIVAAVVVSRIRHASGKELALVGGGVLTSGLGLLVYAGFGWYPLAFAGAAFMGAGLAFIFPPALALVQRVVDEEERGRVSGVLLSLQEFMALVGSLLLLAVGLPETAVQAVLVGIGIVMITVGLLGLRAVRRLEHRERGEAAAVRGGGEPEP